MRNKHTRTPWSLWGKATDDNPQRIIKGGKTLVAQTIGGNDDANAAHIIHCVNLYDELMATLEQHHFAPICGPEFNLTELQLRTSELLRRARSQEGGEA